MDSFFAWIGGFVSGFLDWLFQLVKDIFVALVDLLKAFVVWVFDLVLGAVASVIEAIPAPEFLDGGLQAFLSPIDPGIIWMATQSGLPEGLALLGAGFTFRMTRKAATFFRW